MNINVSPVTAGMLKLTYGMLQTGARSAVRLLQSSSLCTACTDYVSAIIVIFTLGSSWLLHNPRQGFDSGLAAE